MLVLNRYRGQKIRIGDDIVLTVDRVGRGQVTLLIQAPKDVAIRRAELPGASRPGESQEKGVPGAGA